MFWFRRCCACLARVEDRAYNCVDLKGWLVRYGDGSGTELERLIEGDPEIDRSDTLVPRIRRQFGSAYGLVVVAICGSARFCVSRRELTWPPDQQDRKE